VGGCGGTGSQPEKNRGKKSNQQQFTQNKSALKTINRRCRARGKYLSWGVEKEGSGEKGRTEKREKRKELKGEGGLIGPWEKTVKRFLARQSDEHQGRWAGGQ